MKPSRSAFRQQLLGAVPRLRRYARSLVFEDAQSTICCKARWSARRIAVPVKLFDLRKQGFELVGCRLLPDCAAHMPRAEGSAAARGGS